MHNPQAWDGLGTSHHHYPHRSIHLCVSECRALVVIIYLSAYPALTSTLVATSFFDLLSGLSYFWDAPYVRPYPSFPMFKRLPQTFVALCPGATCAGSLSVLVAVG